MPTGSSSDDLRTKNSDQGTAHQKELSFKARFRSTLGTVAKFFWGQGALQTVNILQGLFLVHMLSVEAYAQFGLAFGFQTTASSLMDLGFASTVIPLVGDRLHDRGLVGRYVHAAYKLRTRMFLLLSPFAVISFLAIAHQHHWNWILQVELTLTILIFLYSSGKFACFSPPFLLYRHLQEYYEPQTFWGLGRLASYGLLRLAGALNSWTAALVSALNITLISRTTARRSRRWIEWPEGQTSAEEREIIHYVLPAMPAVIFASFQSQISLFMISIFGQTVSIAQVAALSRIAQLFLVFQTFNMVVIEPYIARIHREQLLATYLRLLILAFVCLTPVVLFSFTFPQAILWLLGPNYRTLSNLIGWLVLTSSINYISGLAYIMNRARKWIFWRGTILEIVLLIGVQIAYIMLIGVHSTKDAVFLGFASSFCYVAAHGYIGVYGFLRGPRILHVE